MYPPHLIIQQQQFRGLINTILAMRGCQTLPIPPALRIQDEGSKHYDLYDSSSDDDKEDDEDSYFKDDEESGVFDANGMMWCAISDSESKEVREEPKETNQSRTSSKKKVVVGAGTGQKGGASNRNRLVGNTGT